MKIKIHKQCIARGEKHGARTCPAALALTQATGWTKIFVGPLAIWVWQPDGSVLQCKPSRELVEFMVDFDLGEPVTPCEFELEFEKIS